MTACSVKADPASNDPGPPESVASTQQPWTEYNHIDILQKALAGMSADQQAFFGPGYVYIAAGNLASGHPGDACNYSMFMQIHGDTTSRLSFLRNYFPQLEPCCQETRYHACAVAKQNMLKATEWALGRYLSKFIPEAERRHDFFWAIGHVTHTIQDSYSPGHAKRDLAQPGAPLLDMCCNTDWPGNAEGGACGCMHSVWGDVWNEDYQVAARYATSHYLSVVYYLATTPLKYPDWEIRDRTTALIDVHFRCKPWADRDGDGYLNEPDLELVPAGKGLDCDDDRPSINDCRGKCADADGDIIPDGCDPCPSLPDHHFISSSQINPGSGKDGDKDGVVDECDVCPANSAVSTLDLEHGFFDKDVDGVANACDNCPKPNPVVACKTDSDCPSAYGQRCIPGSSLVTFGACPGPDPKKRSSCSSTAYGLVCDCQELGQWGRCARQGDLDLDGRGDECDSCPNTTSTDTRNSNVTAEEWWIAPERFDMCDAVPLLRLEPQKTHVIPPIYPDPPFVDYAANKYYKIEDIVASSWIGDPHPADAWLQPIVPFSEPIRFGHCSCYRQDGSRAWYPECTDVLHGWCNPTAWGEDTEMWQVPTLHLPDDGTALPPGGALPQPFKVLKPGPDVTLTWEWDADVRSGRIRGKLTPAGLVPFAESHGVLASDVLMGTGAKSLRDFASTGHLRRDMTLYQTPLVVKSEMASPAEGYPFFECKTMGCQFTLRPWEQYTDPPDFRDPVAEIRAPAVVTWSTGLAALRGPGVSMDIDITDRMSPAVRRMLAESSKWAWLLPSEPVAFLEERGIPQQWAAAPMEDNDPVGVVRVEVSGRLVDVARPPVARGLDRTAAQAGTEAQRRVAPRLSDGACAVYSALEAAVYYVGGVVSGNTGGAIRRLDVTSNELIFLNAAANHQPSGSVLAAALDQPRGRLYWLDVVDRPKPGGYGHPKMARLAAHSMADGSSRVLFTVPYVARHAAVRLGVAEDGDPILVASTHNHHRAWKIDAEGRSPVVKGMMTGQGAAMDGPMMGRYTPVMLVVRNSSLSVEQLGVAAFGPGPGCAEL